MNSEEKDIIFKYYVADAFNMNGFEWIILDKKKNNYIIRSWGYMESEEISTIEIEKIEEIKRIVSDSRIYKIKEIEFPFILDGTDYKYTFNNGKQIKELEASNIYALNIDRSPNAKVVLEIYDAISKVLKTVNN